MNKLRNKTSKKGRTASLALALGSASGEPPQFDEGGAPGVHDREEESGAMPRTDREDKIIRHYCDISWQERYDLMREHAEVLEKELPTFGDESAQHESDEDAFNGWNRDIDGYDPTLWDAYLFGLKRRNVRLKRKCSDHIDALDMMRDEFQRIIACPGCNSEIEDLADRAQLKLLQHVPVIVQRDRAEMALAREREKVRTLRETCESICEEWGKSHDAPFYAGSEMEKLASKALEKTEDAK